MYMDVFPASEFKVTYIHNRNNEKFKKTWDWLERMHKEGRWDEVPHISAVLDPDTQEKLVYDGNARVPFADEHKCKLNAVIIINQADLSTYFLYNENRWFDIIDFRELLEYMRIYAKYPNEDAELPRELNEKINSKYMEWSFGWHDD